MLIIMHVQIYTYMYIYLYIQMYIHVYYICTHAYMLQTYMCIADTCLYVCIQKEIGRQGEGREREREFH